MKQSILFLLGLSLILSSCTKSNDGETSAQPKDIQAIDEVTLTDQQLKILNITLGKIEKRVLSSTVKVNGMLDVPPQNLVTISAPLGGFIKHTELLQGMKVKKGELIAVMEHPDYIQLQQDYLDSKNQLEYLELEYKRQQELATENVNSAKALQLSKSTYLSMKAKTEGLRSKLKLINILPSDIENGEIKNTVSIVSPITGFVMQVNVNIGMYVNPTDVMFKIVDTDHLHAEAQVFERDLAKLKVGQRVLINLTNETVPRIAKVYLIGKEISTERTVRVHCHLEKEDPNLIPGMYFSALIEMGNNPVNALPENAVVSFEGKEYLFTSKNKNTFNMVEIKTGVTESGYTEIMLPDGFDITASIVTNGTYALISKLKNAEE
jgi:membrane fusion protein, heavy metal efflux system